MLPSHPRSRRAAAAPTVSVAIAAFVAGIGGPGAVPAVAGSVPDLHAPWDRILAAVVTGERVDYDTIRAHHLDVLDGYLDALARVDAGDLDRNAALAYWINLYNASMVREVVRHDLDAWTPADGGFEVFGRPLVRTAGGTVSLDHVEHDIVRPRFGDARIHAALVCAAASCPPLLPRAYRAGDLEATLDANMRRFVGDRSRNRIDPVSRTMQLSPLFDWFAEDFGGRDAIDDYIDRWTEPDVRGFAVRFLEYDWSLNRAP